MKYGQRAEKRVAAGLISVYDSALTSVNIFFITSSSSFS